MRTDRGRRWLRPVARLVCGTVTVATLTLAVAAPASAGGSVPSPSVPPTPRVSAVEQAYADALESADALVYWVTHAPQPPGTAVLRDEVDAVQAYVTSLAAERVAAVEEAAGTTIANAIQIVEAAIGEDPNPQPPGTTVVDQAVGDIVTFLRDHILGVDPNPDPALDPVAAAEDLVEQWTPVVTAIAAGAQQTAADVVASLPTAAAILDHVAATEEFLLRQGDPSALDPTLAAADTVLVWAARSAAGVAGDPGTTLSGTRDAAGAVYDALDAALTADGSGVDDVTAPEGQEVASDDLALVPGGVAHPAAPVTATTPVTEAVDAAVAPVKGHCYARQLAYCDPPLNWKGGFVQHHPVVHLIFWGPKWADMLDERQKLVDMFNSMNGSGFQDVLSQYYDASGTVGALASLTLAANTVIDYSAPPAAIPETSILAEARAMARDRWTVTNDAQFLVFPQPDSVAVLSDGVPCGYHGFARRGTSTSGAPLVMTYGAVNHHGRFAGCATSSTTSATPTALNGLTHTASHEYAETVTDPMLNDGWRDNNGIGSEVADMCDKLPAGGSGAQPLWSNNGGTGGCTYGGFTPRYAFSVVTAAAPPAERTGGYVPGHRYTGGHVVLRNTGNMPWFAGGANAIRLATDAPLDRCSAMWDRPIGPATDPSRTANPWLSCRRLRMIKTNAYGVVEPAGYAPATSAAAFDVRYKPDGTLLESPQTTEAFRPIVEGVTVMSGTISLNGRIEKFEAFAIAADIVPVPVAAFPGQTVDVTFVYRNSGSAEWYANEAVYLGTAKTDGHPSVLHDPATWRHSAICVDCRATRVAATTESQATYTFKATLRAPASAAGQIITEAFRPVAEVPTNAGGARNVYFGKPVSVALEVLPYPDGDHALAGLGATVPMATEGVDVSDATNPAPTSHRFGCAAAASPDAISVTVSSCVLTVTSADGAVVGTYSAPAATATAPVVATALAEAAYDPAQGDTVVVCWAAEARFRDLTTRYARMCT